MPFPRKTTLPDERQPHERLTVQGYLVARRVALGKSYRDIAAEMGIHRTTVNRTIERIIRTMGLKCSEDIAKYAKKHGAFGVTE